MINKSLKAITFGSNFGYHVHYKCLKKFYNFDEIAICSPNINKKKIDVYKKFKNYELALKNNYDFISISSLPEVQKKICNIIFKKKIKPKYLILEKPLSENFYETDKLFRKLKKNNIKFFLNFIFVNIQEFKEFKKLVLKNKIKKFDYIWNFKQGFFINKKKTWKISKKDGGGLINYYLIHVFYNLLFFFNNIKIKNVKLIKNGKFISHCKILLNINDTFQMNILMNINSNKNIHCLKFKTKKNIFELSNISKNWVSGFKIKKNKKKLNFKSKKTDRQKLTFVNYLNIKKKRNRKINNLLSEKAHIYCDKVMNF